MTHDALLNNFSIRWMRRAVEMELTDVISDSYSLTQKEQQEYIIKKFLLSRWNCLFSSNEVSEVYKDKTAITIAIYLHKYGFCFEPIKNRAINGLEKMINNENDVMPKHMYKKATFAIEILKSLPKPPRKKLSNSVHLYKREITQFRKGDVFSIKLENNKFAVAVVKEIKGFNEYPIVELFEEQFNEKPTIAQIKNKTLGDAQFSVTNLLHIPDLAYQMQLIGNMDVSYIFRPHTHIKIHKFIEMITGYTNN